MKIYTKTKIYQRFVKKLGNCEDRPELQKSSSGSSDQALIFKIRGDLSIYHCVRLNVAYFLQEH